MVDRVKIERTGGDGVPIQMGEKMVDD